MPCVQHDEGASAGVWSRPVWAEIDVAAYLHNLRALRRLCGVPLLCVLKADGYGHGALRLARAIESLPPQDVPLLGVASVDEGAALRAAGVARPILLLSAILPEEAAAVVDFRLAPTVFTLDVARALHEAAARRGLELPVHVKIDTGMHRLGVPWQQARALFEQLSRLHRLRVAGIYTHFASAAAAAASTQRQRRRFLRALEACVLDWNAGSRPLLHAANSAAAIRFGHARFDLIRPGIATYGLSCGLSQNELSELNELNELNLRPVMSLRARITHQQSIPRGAGVSYGSTWRAPRPSRIATVAAGYADGYPRLASGRAQVLVAGRRAPVVGRVTMDQILVDVTGTGAAVGDTVTLWGRDGSQSISADEVAAWAQTIGYEIVCGVAARVRRVPVNQGSEASDEPRPLEAAEPSR